MTIEAKNKGSSLKFKFITKEQFVSFITDRKEDRFAKTFVSKCDMLNKWDFVIGLWEKDELCGAILTTYSKRQPVVANLQLLHTFYKHRNKGIAKLLCEFSLYCAHRLRIDYFRVSAEPAAIKFYEKIGMKMIGEQKSKCQLSMFRITSPVFSENDYSIDSFIYKNITRKGKGGCVNIFIEQKFACLTS
jgi:GNAT superfamily N-acetyltransferase